MYLSVTIDCIYIAGSSSVVGRQSENSGRKLRFLTFMRENISQTIRNKAYGHGYDKPSVPQ